MAEGPKPREVLAAGLSWVDVRNLAEGHVLALEKENAKDQRIVISKEEFVYQEWGALPPGSGVLFSHEL